MNTLEAIAARRSIRRFKGDPNILGSASLLISSFLMVRSEMFRKATAYVGIVTNIVVFGFYIPEVGVWISMLSVVGYLSWYILIARRLIRLGWSSTYSEA